MQPSFFLLHRSPFVAFAALGAVSLTLFACSTSDASSASALDGGDDDASAQAAEGGTDARTRDAGADAGDTRCQTMKRAACHDCCKIAHEPALYLLQQVTLACVCKPEQCQAACKDTWCADPLVEPASPACDACVGVIADGGGDGVCSPAVKAACNADDDCTALTRCIRACDADGGK